MSPLPTWDARQRVTRVHRLYWLQGLPMPYVAFQRSVNAARALAEKLAASIDRWPATVETEAAAKPG